MSTADSKAFKMNKNNTTSSSNNSNSKRPSATSPSIPHDTPISGHRAGADAGVGRSGDKTTSNKGGSSSSQTNTPTSAVGVTSALARDTSVSIGVTSVETTFP